MTLNPKGLAEKPIKILHPTNPSVNAGTIADWSER